MAFKREFRRDLSRAPRLRWCSPLEVALSIFEVVSRYAAVAASLSLSEISLSNFLMDERSDERWLMLWTRRRVFCRALFRAWGEFAKIFPLCGESDYGRGNIGNFSANVKRNRLIYDAFYDLSDDFLKSQVLHSLDYPNDESPAR